MICNSKGFLIIASSIQKNEKHWKKTKLKLKNYEKYSLKLKTFANKSLNKIMFENSVRFAYYIVYV